ncbi:MAG: acetyl-CoA carboxylase, biotin carboxyl carrier protein [candidate division Zixibacteria bacterium 4484_95]|nr:MAG: acetyl-CoA carboxylase, biotin carboxyl carrier protein [candidate division Zixibacteria bacterium 4484_95]RKX20760.1 MAG: acetyl-CoA carboxylase biotin carboxyl carrier protein [candidate division Zixibacteria bacterium]
MKTSKIKALIKLVEESNIAELEIWHWGKRIRIRKKITGNGNDSNLSNQLIEAIDDKKVKTNIEADETSLIEPVATDKNLLEIKSPMVGTFYRAPAPDAEPFIDVGERIVRGQTVCIIEAMKLMNEIESEYDGRVVKILVQNAQPVQFGQPLFLIEPT